MGRLEEALSLIHEKLKNEYGEDFQLEDGDEVVCVLNDATVILGIENKELQCKVLLGKPLKIDYSIENAEE